MSLRIAVIGVGHLGKHHARILAALPGVELVAVVDINAARAQTAAALGVGFAPPDRASENADVVIHTSGVPAGLQTSLRLAGFESVVVDMSWYGDQLVALPLGEGFHAQRLTIKSSQVGHVPAEQRARWDVRRRRELALRLLADPSLDVLITGESRFDDLPDVMARLANSPDGALCHRIRYSL